MGIDRGQGDCCQVSDSRLKGGKFNNIWLDERYPLNSHHYYAPCFTIELHYDLICLLHNVLHIFREEEGKKILRIHSLRNPNLYTAYNMNFSEYC